jgi:DNA polymerase IV (DinB-like DNA polymerase)
MFDDMPQKMRIIAHLDMDAFFAQVEERDNPRFAGLPIAVGSDPKSGTGRGVVATANYKARVYGIHSAQPISTAWRLSQNAKNAGKPQTIFLPPNFPQYQRVSLQILSILQNRIPLVEQASVDEFYLDLSSFGEYEKAFIAIGKLKSKIKEELRLTCSIGVGPNKLIAKLLSSRFKPDKITVLLPQEVDGFLSPLAVGDIPGIGPKSEAFLHGKDIQTISQLKNISRETLKSWFGKWGEEMYDRIRGVDSSPVTAERETKSISEEETFDENIRTPSILLEKLVSLSDRVCDRMQEEKIVGFRTIGIKIRFSDFATKTRAHSLASLTHDKKIMRREVQRMFLPFLDKRENPKRMAIRLIGVKVENFHETGTETAILKRNKGKSQLSLLSDIGE